jgi:hypothetical protein
MSKQDEREEFEAWWNPRCNSTEYEYVRSQVARSIWQASRTALLNSSAEGAEELAKRVVEAYAFGSGKDKAASLIAQHTAGVRAEKDILEILLRHVCNCWMAYQKAKYKMYEAGPGPLSEFAMSNMPASEGALLDAVCTVLRTPWRKPISEISEEDNQKLASFLRARSEGEKA